MRNRIGVVAVVLLACTLSLRAQENMYKIHLDPSGSMISLNQPVLMSGKYVFRAWPDGAQTALKQARVRKITQLTGIMHETIYKIELVPSGIMIAKDSPALMSNSTYVFHNWRDGMLMSLRKADVKTVTALTGDQAFWATQELDGASKIDNLAMQGASKVVVIGTPPTVDSSQAGASNLNSVGPPGSNNPGINGAPAGNWSYQGQPGVSDAWGPANATMNNGVPTMPAATNGGAPPQ